MEDDFESDTDFTTRWNQNDFPGVVSGAMIENQKLTVESSANGQIGRFRTDLNLDDDDSQCLKADMSYISSSSHPVTTRGRIRLTGYWYNDTSVTYNGVDRVVWAGIQLENQNGSLRATVNGWVEDSTLLDGGADLFWHKFNTQVSEDTTYTVFIELDKANKKLIAGFNGEVYRHNITTPIFDIPNDSFRQLTAELRGDGGTNAAGYLKGQFDNVRVGIACNTFAGEIVSIDPKGSYLAAGSTDSPNPPTKIVLSTLNIYPEDGVEVRVLGDYDQSGGGDDDSHQQLLGVFVDVNDNPIAPHASSTVSTIVSANALPDNLATDITDDFEIKPYSLNVKVPKGAHALWLTPNDSFFSNNTDPNGDYALHIHKVSDGGDMCFPITAGSGKVAVVCL